MPKFKNKKTGAIVEENLIFYIQKLRNNPNFVELPEKGPKTSAPKENKEENVDTPQE